MYFHCIVKCLKKWNCFIFLLYICKLEFPIDPSMFSPFFNLSYLFFYLCFNSSPSFHLVHSLTYIICRILNVQLASANRLALADAPTFTLHSAQTALKGVLSLIHECVDPLYFNFPPPLLLNLNSLASPSTKGKNSGLRSWLYCALWRPAQCSCAFHLHAHFVFFLYQWSKDANELRTAPFFCVTSVVLLVSFLSRASHHGCFWPGGSLFSACLNKHTFMRCFP